MKYWLDQCLIVIVVIFITSTRVSGGVIERLYEAINAGDSNTVKSILDTEKVDVNDRRDDGGTLLMRTAFMGYEDIVQILLANGADVNAEDGNNQTALSYAIKNNKEKIIELLVEAQAKE